MQQLIDMCIETNDVGLFNTLCDKLKFEEYNLTSIQTLNDLIKGNFINSNFINHLIKYCKFDKLQSDSNIDQLIINTWLNDITTQNWKRLLIYFKLCQFNTELYPSISMNPLNNHLPCYIIVNLLERNKISNINLSQFKTVYLVSRIIINNNIIHNGEIYIQSLKSGLYIFISNESILLELLNVKYTKDKLGDVTLKTDQVWCLIGNLKINNIKTISFNLHSNNNNVRSRISTSESIVKLNGDLTPTQDSLIITKCNVKFANSKKNVIPKNKVSKKQLKQKQLNYKIKEPNVKLEIADIDNDDSTTILPCDNSKNHQSEEPITINNPAIPSINNPANSTKNNTISTHTNNFTISLQDQIQQSMDQFSNDLINKINLLNNEVNNTMLQPLAIKYQSRLNDLQLDFRHDIQQIITNFNDLFARLHWNENDLLHFLQNNRRAT